VAEFTIGGEAIQVSLPNFKAMKPVWPIIEAATANPNFVSATDAVLTLVSQRGQPAYSVDQLEDKLTPAEAMSLPLALQALMIEIGLAKPKADTPGEAKPAEGAASPSTGTLTP
jgi:hypothetical protein